MSGTKTAKLFTHGRSQAVRLPKEFRLPGKEVRVSRVGHRVILEPIARSPADVAAVFADLESARQAALSTLTPRRSAASHKSPSLEASGMPSRIASSR